MDRESAEDVAHLEFGPPPATLSSASQPKSPPVQVKTLLETQVERPAPLKEAVKRLDDEAVVEKRLVVVAEVVVELPVIRKLPSTVEEAVERNPPESTRREVVAD